MFCTFVLNATNLLSSQFIATCPEDLLLQLASQLEQVQPWFQLNTGNQNLES